MKMKWPVQEEADKGGNGGGTPPRTIPVDVLPDEMKGMSDQELKFYLSRSMAGLASANETNRELRTKVEQLEQKVNAPPPAAPDPDDEKPIEELIVSNPKKAIARVAAELGFTRVLNENSEKTDEALFAVVSNRIPGFEDYEDDVRKLLRESSSPINERTIKRAYAMAVGDRELESRAAAQRKAQNSEKEKPDPTPPKKEYPEESALEKEIREAHGMERDRWESLKGDSFDIKVPLK